MPQPFEQQIGIAAQRMLAVGENQVAQPACEHHGYRLAQQGFYPFRQSVYLGSRAVDGAVLHTGDSVCAQQGLGRLQRNDRKLGCLGGQGIHRHPNTGKNHAADKAARLIQNREGSGSTQVISRTDF